MSMYWCGTLNNFTDEELIQLITVANLIAWAVKKVIIGKEHINQEGLTPHLQMYWVFKNKKRLVWLKNNVNDNAHWEPRKKSDKEAWDYCQKEDHNPYIWPEGAHGEEIGQGHRSDIARVVQMLKDGKTNIEIIDEVPRALTMMRFMDQYRAEQDARRATTPPDVWFIEGQPGTGKTSTVIDTYGAINVYRMSDASEIKWFDGYAGQEVLVIDDFYMKCKNYAIYFKILDRYQVRVEVKGGHVILRAKKIFILSNYSVDFCCDNQGLDDAQRQSFKRRLHHILKMPAPQEGKRFNFIDNTWKNNEPEPVIEISDNDD